MSEKTTESVASLLTAVPQQESSVKTTYILPKGTQALLPGVTPPPGATYKTGQPVLQKALALDALCLKEDAATGDRYYAFRSISADLPRRPDGQFANLSGQVGWVWHKVSTKIVESPLVAQLADLMIPAMKAASTQLGEAAVAQAAMIALLLAKKAAGQQSEADLTIE